jgi:hypothetical protein
MQPVSGLESIQEIDWELGGISTLQVPLERPNDIAVWDYALNGLSLTGYWT